MAAVELGCCGGRTRRCLSNQCILCIALLQKHTSMGALGQCHPCIRCNSVQHKHHFDQADFLVWNFHCIRHICCSTNFGGPGSSQKHQCMGTIICSIRNTVMWRVGSKGGIRVLRQQPMPYADGSVMVMTERKKAGEKECQLQDMLWFKQAAATSCQPLLTYIILC